LLYLGHISKAKGIYFLLDSLISAMETDSKLKAYSLKVPLSLILTGTLLVSKDEILAKINKLQTLGIACELKGPVYGVEKYALFNRASVFVHASFSEALPLTILEAYSVGLPVVVRRVGGMKDIVMPVTGVFFDNELELVSGVLSVLSNIYDRGTIQSVYRNNYSPDYFSKNLLKIIGS